MTYRIIQFEKAGIGWKGKEIEGIHTMQDLINLLRTLPAPININIQYQPSDDEVWRNFKIT